MKFNIPEGTRDYTNEECKRRNEISSSLLQVFNCWGYDEIETPTMEFYNTYNLKEQYLKEEEIYKFFDNNGRIVVLRPDMTIPVARLVSTKLKDLKAPIKLCYSSNIFSLNESLLGRQNEYKDCGVELIGVEDEKSDLEVIVTAIEAIKSLNFKNFKLEIGNVNIIKSAMKEMGLSKDESSELAELIDKKSLPKLKSYIEALNLSTSYKDFLVKLPWLFGEEDILDKANEFDFSTPVKESINYLRKLYDDLCKLGYKEYITVDLSMVPKLNYYTGTIFKGYVEGGGATILTGGRYDNLIKNYGRDLPAIGFSLKVDLILSYLEGKEDDTAIKDILIQEEEKVNKISRALKEVRKGNRVKILY